MIIKSENLCGFDLCYFSTDLTKDEIMAQCVMFFLVGYETTANALSFLMFLLALNPEIQQKLYEEILETLDDQVYLGKFERDLFLARLVHVTENV